MHKTRTWLNNAHDAGQEYTCKTVVGMDRAKQYIMPGHTSGKWFGQFMKGARMRMGIIHKQNEASTSALVMVVYAVAETRWHSTISDKLREELEDAVCFMLATFGAALRGEEVPLISMEGLLTFWEKSKMKGDSHVMLTLKGRFKGEVDERWHLVPVSGFLWSGLPFRLWMKRAFTKGSTCIIGTSAGSSKTGGGCGQNLEGTMPSLEH